MKIICVGQNYLNHIKELNSKINKSPILFLKPDSSIIQKNQPFFIPEFSKEIHYEVEIILKFDKLGKHIDRKFSNKYYNQISLGIDFTARDLQEKLKKSGHPWEKAKSFDNSAVIGDWIDINNIQDINNINFCLRLNNEVVQSSNSSNMIWKIDDLVTEVSNYFTLKIGDILFTGTPEGVGKVSIGDVLDGFLEEKKVFSIKIK
ncbi:MAG: 2-hydroxyhepta-2,4-diene-1,7-dioate isomerase [Flavobacteriaceae bacterium]|nr:2-hydroxyhepta-2,4-diene-1,7-dioate isomerase [Flavobacteriaceae bacterium]|tara:strand:+ start:1958 stop:2569 length:612 start_codon:yes stop_codon:yes gene_type:complete